MGHLAPAQNPTSGFHRRKTTPKTSEPGARKARAPFRLHVGGPHRPAQILEVVCAATSDDFVQRRSQSIGSILWLAGLALSLVPPICATSRVREKK